MCGSGVHKCTATGFLVYKSQAMRVKYQPEAPYRTFTHNLYHAFLMHSHAKFGSLRCFDNVQVGGCLKASDHNWMLGLAGYECRRRDSGTRYSAIPC
jgi:hypothetical protein